MAAKEQKIQDEKNLKILRELAALPANKYCFDCQQRGTTYINMTVGSFVCSSCSGQLRGLNPPHRLKSITVASFTPEEMEQIKSKGNEYSKLVWLGKYNPSIDGESQTFQNVHKLKEFMRQTYEDKRYYIEPDLAVLKKTKPRAPSIPNTIVSQSKSQTSIAGSQPNHLLQKTGWMSQDFSSGDTTGCTKEDLFKDFENGTFKQPTTNIDAADESSFADFGSAFGNSEFGTLNNPATLPGPSVSSTLTSSTEASVVASTPLSTVTPKAIPKKPAPPPPDRYAALADLDNELHQQQALSVTSTICGPTLPPAVTSVWSNNTSPAFGTVVFDTAMPNPFSQPIPTWSQQHQIPAANPFQGVPLPLSMPFQNPANGATRGSDTLQNSENSRGPPFWSPAQQFWNPTFSNPRQIDMPTNKAVPAIDHYNPWAQSLSAESANPFMNGSGASVSAAVPPRAPSTNPFL